jgi:cytochrome P450
MSDTLTSDPTEAAAAAPDYPMERTGRCPFAPPERVMELAAAAPLSRVRIWDGSTPWLITGYEEARALFADARVSVDDRRSGFPHWNAHMLSTVDKRPRSVFTSDAEEHTFYRRMLSKPFTFKRVEGLRPAIQKITDEAIDAILAGPKPAELVSALALPVPTLVICEMLGVPYEDHGFFQEHANVGLARYAKPEDSMKGAMSLAKYLSDLVETKMANPAEDAVSDLAERVKAGEISVKEAAQLASGLLIAGHETTANMIGIGVLALLENPDQLAVVRDTDDPKVVANAVEELLRYLSIIQNGQRRVAIEDIEIAGETIRGGEGIIIDLSPADWDAKAFPHPDQLQVQRPDADKHLAFGYGRHQCVGQQLARAELQIVFSTLLRRIPTLTLAKPLDEIPFKNDKLAYGVYELPVTW